MAFVPMDLSGSSRSTTLPAPERHVCWLSPFLRRPPVKGRNERTSISSAQCRSSHRRRLEPHAFGTLEKCRASPHGFGAEDGRILPPGLCRPGLGRPRARTGVPRGVVPGGFNPPGGDEGSSRSAWARAWSRRVCATSSSHRVPPVSPSSWPGPWADFPVGRPAGFPGRLSPGWSGNFSGLKSNPGRSNLPEFGQLASFDLYFAVNSSLR